MYLLIEITRHKIIAKIIAVTQNKKKQFFWIFWYLSFDFCITCFFFNFRYFFFSIYYYLLYLIFIIIYYIWFLSLFSFAENDEIDILSISKIEAEFIYNKSDTATANEETKKKVINLDSFQIIKVIGKGKYFVFIFVIVVIFVLFVVIVFFYYCYFFSFVCYFCYCCYFFIFVVIFLLLFFSFFCHNLIISSFFSSYDF